MGPSSSFAARVRDIWEKTGNRAILLGGCDITPGTPGEHLDAFFAACDALRELT